MAACIISTAQQARPKVIHISEPVRAQLMRSSVAVTRKPLSASSSLIARKSGSSAPTGLPVRGSRMPLAHGATSVGLWRVINPIRALPSSIRRRSRRSARRGRPSSTRSRSAPTSLKATAQGNRKATSRSKMMNSSDDEIEAHVEFHARVVESVEAALIGRELLRIAAP